MNRIIYVDMDGVLCDFEAAMDRGRKARPDILYPQSVAGFYRELVPIPGAVEAMATLSKSAGADLYILTAPSVYNPLCYTEKRLWVEDQLGFDMTHKLIICPDKSLLRGHFLIDDHASGRGQDRFEGTLVQFGSAAYRDWNAVMDFLSLHLSE